MTKEELNKELIIIKQSVNNIDAFGLLYDKYYKQIFLFICKRTSNKSIAADITSTVFMKALENISKYEYRGFPFSSWLYRIAINEINSFYRKSTKNIEVSISENEANAMLLDSDMDYSEENRGLLIDILNELPQEMTHLIDLRFFEKQSFREIGQVFGITEANAKVKVYRVLKKMKKMVTLKTLIE